ncbi:hypothetical protein ACTFIW_007164 [Dictyostelium discoideum]
MEEVCLMNFKDNEHSVRFKNLDDLKKVKEEAIKIGINIIVFHFQVGEKLINTLLKIKPKSVKRVQEQYNLNCIEGFIDITNINSHHEEEVRKVLNFSEDDEVVYASFVMKRYEYEHQGLSFFIDCVFYDEVGKYALYGRIKTQSDNTQKFENFFKTHEQLLPVKSKIIHYLEICEVKDLPSSAINKIGTPNLISYDPFYLGYNN